MYTTRSFESESLEKNVFRILERKSYYRDNFKEKLADFLDFALVITPFLASIAWILFVSLIWDAKEGLTIDSGTEIFILGIFIVLFSLVPLIAFLSVWSRIQTNPDRLAGRIFTKKNIENSTQEILASYLYASPKIQKIFRSKLRVSPDQLDYMTTLVNEGYRGSVKDLVTIVKKL